MSTYLLLLLLQILLSGGVVARNKNLVVIDLKAKGQTDTSIVQNINDGSVKTREVSICFRFMTQFNPSFFIVTINQINIWFDRSQGFVYLKSQNATTRNDEYCRRFQYCQTYVPGHWMSICLSIKLSKNTQEITVYQDGDPCFNEKYFDGDFEWIFVDPSISLADM